MSGLAGVDYRDEDVALRGELALPRGAGPHPGVLVLHGGLGFGDEVRGHARRLAEAGYAALVADMYGSHGHALPPGKAGAQMLALQGEPMRLRARAAASLQALAEHPAVDGERLAALGFCFGGQCALELARAGAELKAAACFHGQLTTAHPAAPGAIRGEIAVFTGSKDPLAPPDHVAQLRAELSRAGARWQITEYGEGWHGFMDDRRDPMYDWIRYDPVLHARAWAATLALLATALRPADLSPGGHFAHEARAPAAIH